MKEILKKITIDPKDVHSSLRKHMLIEGFDMVVDLEKSAGNRIYDARTGKQLLDFFTFFASSPIGLNHPKMRTHEAKERLIRAAVNKPSNSDVYTVEMAEFVETFSRTVMPEYLSHLFLIEGGALAVENALKVSFDWKIRKNLAKGYAEERGNQIIHFRESFHGRTGYTLSMTNTANLNKTKYFPKFNWPRIVNPKIKFPLEGKNLDDVVAVEKEAIQHIKKAFVNNKDDIAAIIIEPIQGEGGDNHFRVDFLRELRNLADENEVMLIFDEVQTGLGLTGKWWVADHFDAKPDIICFGKKVQVCGIMCGRRIDEVEENVFRVPSRINSTWGGNLTDMVRSTMYMEIIVEEDLVRNAAHQGEYLLGELQKLQDELPEFVRNVRGRGLMCAFDCPDPQQRDALRKLCYENNLVVLGCGVSSIRFRPALTVSRTEINEAMDILRRSIKKQLSRS